MSTLFRYSLLLVGLLTTSFVYAQPAANQLAPTTSDTSLLWRISGRELAEPSYLFGTIHMIPAEDYFLPSTVANALSTSRAVAFEIDPRDMEDPSALFGIIGKINMLNDTTLNDLLSEADYKVVNDYFEEAGLPMVMFKRMKPLFLSAMVGEDMSKMMGGGMGTESGIKSYELELTRLAEAGKKDISGLETMEFQLSLFDSIPYKAQAQMLLEAVKADSGVEEKGENQFQQMVAMYKRQAIFEMANMIHEEGASTSRFEELLLTRRNQSWIKPMQELMSTGTAFFAVGAGHLAGDQGVIALLRQSGYSVEAIYE
ncbi:TraB/GumN family protein [Lewinellaceae bacterium SD302]|nr:TraB/GumN family protein [Lewinellaceae bacterium SD302]